MIRKPFEQNEYDQCNDIAIKKVKDLLTSFSAVVIDKEKEDYQVDITIFYPTRNKYNFHEVEIKKVWDGDWNPSWTTLQIPERKGKFAKENYFIWVLNKDTTKAWVFDARLLTSDILKEVPNKKIASGERFYQVPIKQCFLCNLEN